MLPSKHQEHVIWYCLDINCSFNDWSISDAVGVVTRASARAHTQLSLTLSLSLSPAAEGAEFPYSFRQLQVSQSFTWNRFKLLRSARKLLRKTPTLQSLSRDVINVHCPRLYLLHRFPLIVHSAPWQFWHQSRSSWSAPCKEPSSWTASLCERKSMGLSAIAWGPRQFIVIIIICPLTASGVGAPQMISQPVSSILPCSPAAAAAAAAATTTTVITTTTIIVDDSVSPNLQLKARAQCAYRKMQNMYIYTTD